MELKNKAISYAIEKSNEVMAQTIVQAYMDGYREGYQTCENQKSDDSQVDNTKYVDLGLPSGTLWAADYEKDGDRWKYIPYDKASVLNIPTEEDWTELLETCEWNYINNGNGNPYFQCRGRNGKEIKFYFSGAFQEGEILTDTEHCVFWIKDEIGSLIKNAVKMRYWYKQRIYIEKVFKGYKLPIRLVRKKNTNSIEKG